MELRIALMDGTRLNAVRATHRFELTINLKFVRLNFVCVFFVHFCTYA